MIELRIAEYLKKALSIIVILLISVHFILPSAMHFVLYLLAIVPLTIVIQIMIFKYQVDRRVAFFAFLTMFGLIVSLFFGGGHG